MTTATALVAEAATLMFGRDWVTPLHRALGERIALRTLQRIAASAHKGQDYPAARGVLTHMPALLDRHDDAVADVRRKVENFEVG